MSHTTLRDSSQKIHDMIYIAIFAVLIAICSWISIPTTVPFSLQTMGVFLTVGVLGGKRGTLAVLIYILLGAVGVPVFAGFTSGLGVLLGSTGGYIIGFIGTALTMWAAEHWFGKGLPVLIVSMLLGLIVCYAFGSAWFSMVYSRANGAIGLMSVLSMCVFPFIIPDLIKISVAVLFSKQLQTIMGRRFSQI